MDYLVEGKSRKELRALAYSLREHLGLTEALYFPVVETPDVLEEIIDKFSYEIVEDDELPISVHAETDVVTGHIKIKDSVYNRAAQGEGRDRMTIAHEIGHFFTICVCGFKLQRNFDENAVVPPYRRPEWQAKCFAGELMVPAHLIDGLTPLNIAEKCGVSESAASFQYEHKD